MPSLSLPDVPTLTSLDYNNPDTLKLGFLILLGVGLIGLLLWIIDNMFAPIAVVAHGIVGFFGKRGSGKSLSMTAYARRWRLFNKNKPVFTNMEKLELPGYNGKCICVHIHKELDPSEIMGDKHEQCRYVIGKCKAIHTDCNFAKMKACRDGLIAIDEAGIFISNLNFGNRANREFARWLVATRHYKVMVLLTAHTPGTINNRLRDVLDQLVEMTAFTTLRLFRGYVYDSGKVYGMPDKKSHTIWIPMLPSVTRSYNTDSLRLKADQENRDIVGEDFDLPWDSDGDPKAKPVTTTGLVSQTTTIGSGDDSIPYSTVDNLSRNATGTSRERAGSVLAGSVDMELLDATILSTLVSKTAETWNGRKERPKLKAIQRAAASRR